MTHSLPDWVGPILQLHHHGEAITTLPDGGKGLAKSDDTAVQPLPKACEPRVPIPSRSVPANLELVRFRGPVHGAGGRRHDAIERRNWQADSGYADYEQFRVQLLERVALLLMPVDRRFAGTSGSCAH